MAEKESKKRKRHSNGLQTPSKKVAVQDVAQPSGPITVNFIQQDLHPAIVSTPGFNVPGISFKAYTRARSSKHADQKASPDTHDMLLQSSKHPRLNHTASPDALEQQLSHYVAVLDPASNSLQITPVHRLSLHSTVRAEDEEVAARGTIMQQREDLGREFGTKKARKVIASRTENAITTDTKGKGKATDVQSAILEAVEDVTSGIGGRNDQEDADLLLASKPIPRPNLEAETVEEVYKFDTLIPANESRLLQVKEWQDKTRAGEAIMFHHQFPARRVEALGQSDDIPKLKALRYLTLLLEFYATLSKGGRSGRKVPRKDVLTKRLASWPAPLVDTVRRRFADESGGELSKWHMDNLSTHICALALYVDGWITDTNMLKDDLRMETRQLGQYFAELGCKVAAPTASEQTARGLSKAMAANTRIARLRLPLEFPKPRKGKRMG